jgi:hypothetical protein
MGHWRVSSLRSSKWFGHVHPIGMGYHDVRGEGNNVPEWRNQGQSSVKS